MLSSCPFLVLGVHQGVLVGNTLSLLVSLVVLAQTWRRASLQMAVRIAGGIVVSAPCGHMVTRYLSSDWLLVVIGPASQ